VLLVEAHHGERLAQARTLIDEYVASLGIDLSFQDIGHELASLPGDYQPPGGCLLLALVDGAPGGCVALRPLDGERCEMKRLWVRPRYRGLGLGRLLTDGVIAVARQGYRRMLLDTLPSMQDAQALYVRLGFVETAPYRHNPVPGARFFELDLRAAPGAANPGPNPDPG
jgi:putative acetyltransferase